MIRNADLFDLIKLQMKTSENKIQQYDRFISNALHSKNAENMRPDEFSQGMISERQSPNRQSSPIKLQNPHHFRQDTEITIQNFVDSESPIKENLENKQYIVSMKNSPSQKSQSPQRSFNDSQFQSPVRRQPFNESNYQNIMNFQSMDQSVFEKISLRTQKQNDFNLPLQRAQVAQREVINQNNNVNESISVKSSIVEQPSQLIYQPVVQSNDDLLQTLREQISQLDLAESPSHERFKFQMQPIIEPVQEQAGQIEHEYNLQDNQMSEHEIDSHHTQSIHSAHTQRIDFSDQVYSQNLQLSMINHIQVDQNTCSTNKQYQTNLRIEKSQEKFDNSFKNKTMNKTYFSKISQAYNTNKSHNRSQSRNSQQRDKSQTQNMRGVAKTDLSQSKTFLKRDTSQIMNSQKINTINQVAQCSATEKSSQLNQQVKKTKIQQLSKKQKLKASFKEVNLQMFVELARIKKPQKIAFLVGRMICLLVNQMRDRQINEDFMSWVSIQSFINQSVNKFTQEVQALKQKILDLNFEVDFFVELRDQFFQDEYQFQQLMNQASDKNQKSLIQLVHNIVVFVLYKKLRLYEQTITDIDMTTSNTMITQNDSPLKSASRTNMYSYRSIIGKDNGVSPKPNINYRNISKSPIGTLSNNTSIICQDASERKHNFINQSIIKDFKQTQKTPIKFQGNSTQKFGDSKTKRKSNEKSMVRNSTQKSLYHSNNLAATKEKPEFRDTSQTGRNSVNPSLQSTQRIFKPRIIKAAQTPLNYTSKYQSKSPLRVGQKLPNFIMATSTSQATLQYQPASQISKVVQDNILISPQKHHQRKASKQSSGYKSPRGFASPTKLTVQSPQKKSQNQTIMSNYSTLQKLPTHQIPKEASFDVSPSKLRDMVSQSLNDMCFMIMESAKDIEQNIKTENVISDKIDLNIIDQLKRRRLEQTSQNQNGDSNQDVKQRRRGDQLEIKRDEIILQVQQQLEREKSSNRGAEQ
eukprot:403355156